LIQQIIVNDANRVRVGSTFPRRAKQLVSKDRAAWLDQAHTEIILTSSKTEGVEMKTGILNENAGGGVDATISRKKDKSIIKNAYRDDVSVVLSSSPIEIIKKSKRRTRELHTAFSIVLWSGAAILYIVANYFMGNRAFTLNPAEMSSTWLIFVFAALIECAVEIFFCRKELAVLNENIDLRQIDPAKKGGDLDLRAYKKSLTRKIRVMTSAVMWIPLIIIFFIGGYVFNLWGVLWVVFLLGLFIEFLFNFMRKLRKGQVS